MRAAMIVAHPDDEIIWGGGLILQHPDWAWTVLSLCRADDPDRRPKFEAVCKRLGVTGIISDLDDSELLAPIEPERDIASRIASHLADVPWGLCVTHGPDGEYGHRRHKEVHAAVLGLLRDGMMQCVELWTFAYECDSATGGCRAAPWADMLVDLTAEQLAEKRRIVREEYGYAADSFEVTSCVSPEGFNRRYDAH